MAGHIQFCYVCPRCEAGLTSVEDVMACPECGLPLGKQPLAPYSPPYCLSEQHEKYKDPDALIEALASMPIEKANSIMNDALLIIENIGGKKTRVEGISIVVGLGIRIGEIAKAYEDFLKAGGRHHPTHYIKTEQQQQQQEIQDEPKKRVAEVTPAFAPSDGRGVT